MPVTGGTTTVSAADEVSLDVEEAIGAAPGLDHAYVYVAPPAGTIASVVNAIVAGQTTTHVHVISDSWGVCEDALSPARAESDAQALELAAVAGISVFAASGDDGSYDCFGFPSLSVDDPASQPFATGVGGTALNTNIAPGQPQHEVTWNEGLNAGGGGVSRFWPAPAWQTGTGVQSSFSSGVPCQASPGICREVPDMALDAATGSRGYLVYCTAGPCGGAGWQTIGGTSGAAPLMAGIAADANEYSLAHGGSRMGYANPFLYHTFQNDPSAFHDVTLGTNNVAGKSQYPATAGYDMATGIGSPDAMALAMALSTFTPAAVSLDPTTLTASPTGTRTIRFGQNVTFSGVLRGSGGPLSHGRVFLQLEDQVGIREWTRFTDPTGHWSVVLSTAIDRKAHWHAAYLGSQTQAPAVKNGFTIYVIPSIALGSSLPLVHGVYQARPGQTFDLRGHTMRSLAGRPVVAEYRPSTGSTWTRIGPAGVTSAGLYHRYFKFPHTGNYVVRWIYQGSTSGQWLSGVSSGHLFAVRP